MHQISNVEGDIDDNADDDSKANVNADSPQVGDAKDKDAGFTSWLRDRVKKVNGGNTKCDVCVGVNDSRRPPRGHWKCKGCNDVLPRDAGFNKWLQTRKNKVDGGTARCNACVEKASQEIIAMKKGCMEHVQKKRRKQG